MTIKRISQHPELIPVLASWFHKEWGGCSPYHLRENEIPRLNRHASSQTLPFTLIAFLNEKPVGCASVVTHDTSSFPWLTNVFVATDYRNLGIGSHVVNSASEEVKRLGFQNLYLVTIDKARFFSRLGWQTVQTKHFGRIVTTMERKFATPFEFSQQQPVLEQNNSLRLSPAVC